MHFKRFFEFKPNKNNIFIIYRDGKVIYDLDEKTFMLQESFLSYEVNSIKIGIAITDNSNIYAVDVTNSNFQLNEQGYQSLVEYDLRHMMSMLNEADLNLVGRANQLLHWLRSNTHCGYCGALKKHDNKEGALFCSCNNVMTYPTISPCVLCLIKKDNKILLARNAMFPEGLYSVLAGFIETSETAEQTLEREVHEEVGLKVKNIKYFGTQSWPFPSQLMIGYICEYKSGEINVDGVEIIDAKWFDLENMPNTPPNSTLSGRLINSYIAGHSKP